MGRREITSKRLANLRSDINQLNKYSHLSDIAQRLLEVLNAVSLLSIPNKDTDGLLEYVETILPLFPQPKSDDNRFLFDAHMIHSFRESTDSLPVWISRMILPTCGKEWSYRPVYLPSLDRTKIPRVDLISFKGETQVEHIDLLDYPWLYHELGHIVLSEHCESFGRQYIRVLDKVLRGLKARSLGDSLDNKRRAVATAEMLESYWAITGGRWSWAIEIGSDIIALWICGPAFLNAFENVLNYQEPNPYLIRDQHPSYEIRVISLMNASSKLGWSDYTLSLKQRVKFWKRSSFKKNRTNEYLSYANREILDAAISSALQMCKNLNMPVCNQDTVTAIRNRVKNKVRFDFGAELVIAAWLINKKFGGDEYCSWERETLEALGNNIRQ